MKKNKFAAALVAASLATGLVALPAVAKNEDAKVSQTASDMFLKGRVVSALALNRHVSVFDFDTKVEGGVAYISGTVEAPIERDIAIETVRGVDDVRDVKADIAVKSGTRKAREDGRTIGKAFDDAATTASVKTKLLANQNTGGLKINVTTKNGIVTLSGKAKSEAERDLAEQIAENTDGVADVRNELKIRM